MLMKPFLLVQSAVFVVLVGCTSIPTPVDSNDKVLGRLEVVFSSESAAPKAVFSSAKLGTAALTVQPEASFTFVPPTSVLTRDASGIRTLSATFGITQTSGSTLQNIMLVAYNQADNNVGGTAVKNIFTFGGSASSSNAQSIKPAHGTNGSLAVDPFRADMGILLPLEANNLTVAARNAGVIGASDTALEYGFIARRSATSHLRSIASGSTGQVTLAVQLPTAQDNAPTTAPYRFALTFIVTTDDTDIVTQSLEEQNNDALVSARIAAIGKSTTVRLLRGSSFTGRPQQRLCGTRLATGNAAFLTAPSLGFLGARLNPDSTLTADFDAPLDSSSLGNGLVIQGLRSGKRLAGLSLVGNSVQFTPTSPTQEFSHGEEVLLSVTNQLRSVEGGQLCGQPAQSKLFRMDSSRKDQVLSYRRPIKIAMNAGTLGGQRISALADLNNDGKADLVTISMLESKVFTRLGTGLDNTYFGALTTTNLIERPKDLDIADMNSDSLLDLVIHNLGSPSSFSILLGNGLGGFSSLTTFPLTGTGNEDVLALGDVTGDGKPDLVTLENTSIRLELVVVTRANSTIAGAFIPTFGAIGRQIITINSTTNTSPPSPHRLVIDDLDLNGVADTIIAIQKTFEGNNDFTLLYKSMNGGAFQSLDALQSQSCTIATANLDNDPQKEIGFACNGQNSAIRFPNNSLTLLQKSNLLILENSVFADLNGDGKKEWITVGINNTSTLAQSSLEVRYSAEGGLFGFSTMIPGFLTPQGDNGNQNLFGVAAADLNGDGKLEIVAGDDDAGAQVWRHEKIGSFRKISVSALNPRDIMAADLTNDGKTDIAVANVQTSGIYLHRGTDNGFATQESIAVQSSQVTLASGDANNDGRVDAFVAAGFGLGIQLSSRTGGFTAGTGTAESFTIQGLAVTDFNNDGNLDAIVSGFGTAPLRILLGDGTGAFTTGTTQASTDVSQLMVADINADGNMDVLALQSTQIAVFLGSGDGNLTPATPITTTARAFALTDINADNTPDIIYATGTNLEYRLNSARVFGSPQVINSPFQPVTSNSLAIGDFNGDGFNDLLATNGNNVMLYGGLSTGGFAVFATASEAGLSPSKLQAADINQDGLLDAFVTNITENSITLLLRF